MVIPNQKSKALFADRLLRAVAILLTAAVLARPIHAAQVSASPAIVSSPISLPSIQANDNRVSAGKLENGVLTLHRTARGGVDTRSGKRPKSKSYAFAEEGKVLQVPCPLIRVPEGTEIRLTLRNLRWNCLVGEGAKVDVIISKPNQE